MLGRLRSPYRELEKAIGYRFRKRELLVEALTHRSYRFESEAVAVDNQRLEFLGDAALGFVCGAYLFERHPDWTEGKLTAERSRMTSGRAICAVARGIGLGAQLQVGKGEEQSGGRERASNLTDALESILGAAYLDGGIRAVTRIFEQLFVPLLAVEPSDAWEHNPKGRLQEVAQQEHREAPVYAVLEETGPAHERTFVVEVRIRGRAFGTGRGSNKRDAESRAAADALARWPTPPG